MATYPLHPNSPQIRNPDGTIKKGYSLNPAGKAPGTGDAQVLSKINEHFKGDNLEKLFKSWQWLIDHHSYRAIELAMAYLAGKPVQAIDMHHDTALQITVTHVGGDQRTPELEEDNNRTNELKMGALAHGAYPADFDDDRQAIEPLANFVKTTGGKDLSEVIEGEWEEGIGEAN